jgi:chromosome segregation ATPase
MAKINEKSTKKEILAYLDTKITEIKELKAGKFNPVADAKNAENKAILGKVETTIEGYGEQINEIKNQLISELDGLNSGLLFASKEYKNIQTAIELVKAELEELYGVKKETETLAGLIDAQKAVRLDNATDTKELKTKYSEMDTELTKNYNAKLKETTATIAKLKSDNEEDLARTQEQQEYDLKIDKRDTENQINENLKGKEKVVDARIAVKEKQVADKIEEADKKTTEIEELRIKFTVEAEKESVRLAKLEEGIDGLTKKKVETAKRFITASYEADIKVLNNSVTMKDDRIAQLEKEAVIIAKKLDDAYKQINAVSLKSLQKADVINNAESK